MVLRVWRVEFPKEIVVGIGKLIDTKCGCLLVRVALRCWVLLYVAICCRILLNVAQVINYKNEWSLHPLLTSQPTQRMSTFTSNYYWNFIYLIIKLIFHSCSVTNIMQLHLPATIEMCWSLYHFFSNESQSVKKWVNNPNLQILYKNYSKHPMV